jgi:hypothetical protein
MDCSDASVDFCTSLHCLLHGKKSKQAARTNNISRKRQCSAKSPGDQPWVVYDSCLAIRDEPLIYERVVEGPLKDIAAVK